ncbi:hypothetical protein [Allobranchiibius huperziae]|uniref:Uncharacterized protein n=1 Tax=Allobranchiibius huperziae TaxID=1874116 RepID=A0A853DCI6_9MICO|nr:hypothetical protein [Allobranchiibius huperziae]NYJ73709.1 hypothetical protein [Allobranchiibius huperziae]
MAGTGGVALLQDPRPDDVRRALQRVTLRWRQLPVDRADALSATVRTFAARCAELDPADIPELGPATAVDQLSVAVFDACASGRSAHLSERLGELLAQLA